MFFGVYSVNLWLDIALIGLNFVVAVIMLIGLYYEKALLMIPFIVSEVSYPLIIEQEAKFRSANVLVSLF